MIAAELLSLAFVGTVGGILFCRAIGSISRYFEGEEKIRNRDRDWGRDKDNQVSAAYLVLFCRGIRTVGRANCGDA